VVCIVIVCRRTEFETNMIEFLSEAARYIFGLTKSISGCVNCVLWVAESNAWVSIVSSWVRALSFRLSLHSFDSTFQEGWVRREPHLSFSGMYQMLRRVRVGVGMRVEVRDSRCGYGCGWSCCVDVSQSDATSVWVPSRVVEPASQQPCGLLFLLPAMHTGLLPSHFLSPSLFSPSSVIHMPLVSCKYILSRGAHGVRPLFSLFLSLMHTRRDLSDFPPV
jgi:hypothetical protein